LNKLWLSVDDTTPRTDQDVDLTIQVLDRYNDRIRDFDERVYFTVQEKSGSSWKSASSRDFDLNTTSYTFRNNDNGYIKLNNLISFENSWSYRLKVRSTNWVTSYVYFTVSTSSNSYSSNNYNYNNNYNNNYNYNNSSQWFSTSELRIVRRVYNQWGTYISSLEDDYPRLRNNSTWQRMQSDLYFNMWKVLNNRSSVWDDYDDYYGDFLVFVSYTISAR
jgi:hypothetical protein